MAGLGVDRVDRVVTVVVVLEAVVDALVADVDAEVVVEEASVDFGVVIMVFCDSEPLFSAVVRVDCSVT